MEVPPTNLHPSNWATRTKPGYVCTFSHYLSLRLGLLDVEEILRDRIISKTCLGRQKLTRKNVLTPDCLQKRAKIDIVRLDTDRTILDEPAFRERAIQNDLDRMQFEAALGSNPTGRRFCITEKGFMGWISFAARVGDIVGRMFHLDKPPHSFHPPIPTYSRHNRNG